MSVLVLESAISARDGRESRFTPNLSREVFCASERVGAVGVGVGVAGSPLAVAFEGFASKSVPSISFLG